MRKEDVKKGSIYELDGVVPLKEALPLGIQHVLAMFLGNISPLLIIAGMLGLSPDLKSALIQNAMFIAGAVTLIQCGKWELNFQSLWVQVLDLLELPKQWELYMVMVH